MGYGQAYALAISRGGAFSSTSEILRYWNWSLNTKVKMQYNIFTATEQGNSISLHYCGWTNKSQICRVWHMPSVMNFFFPILCHYNSPFLQDKQVSYSIKQLRESKFISCCNYVLINVGISSRFQLCWRVGYKNHAQPPPKCFNISITLSKTIDTLPEGD